eukprot:5735308-Lingulodinium_polyedra.AAC.1
MQRLMPLAPAPQGPAPGVERKQRASDGWVELCAINAKVKVGLHSSAARLPPQQSRVYRPTEAQQTPLGDGLHAHA